MASNERDQVLLWTPISTTQLALQLNIPYHNMDTLSCIAIIFYGCTSGEGLYHFSLVYKVSKILIVVNHEYDEISPAITS